MKKGIPGVLALALFTALLFPVTVHSQYLWVDTGFDGYSGTPGTTPPLISLSWHSTSPTSYYTSAGNFGVSAPSYKFGNDGDHLITLYIPHIDSISFWMKGNGAPFSPQNELRFYTSTDSVNYTLFESIDSLPTSGTQVTVPVNALYGVVKIEYVKAPAGGNLAFDDLKIYAAAVIGLNDETPETPVSVFPTPTSGLINIKSAAGSGMPEVEVYDIIGNKIPITAPERKAPGHYTINISGRNKGFYFIKIRSGFQFVTKRITLSD